jgi:hypothetical protein
MSIISAILLLVNKSEGDNSSSIIEAKTKRKSNVNKDKIMTRRIV